MKADALKGLSGRTLVEWHKAEAMAMSRAKSDHGPQWVQARSHTYEEMLREIMRGE
jgi:hypothetical protein